MTISLSHPCSLLISSCDAYSDLWESFFALLDRHWPDLPFPLFLGTGGLSCSHPRVTTLTSKRGADWSGCMREYLCQIETEFVLVMLDDFFLRSRVRTSEVLSCLEFSRAKRAVQVRLVSRPRPTRSVIGEEIIGESEPGSPYRLSTQAAIWHRQTLLEILRDGESIWQFEHNGNERIGGFSDGFYATWRSVLPYEGVFTHHVIEKGRWFPHEKYNLRRMQIPCNFSRRGTLPWIHVALYAAAMSFHSIISRLPWRVRLRVTAAAKRVAYYCIPGQLRRMSGKGNII